MMTICIYAQEPMPMYIALVLDVSGSMSTHGFDRAKEYVTEQLSKVYQGNISYLIPFAENAREKQIVRMSYEDTKSLKADAIEKQVMSLRADGKYTNFNEGINTAKLKLLEELGEAQRSIVLITDGISDPDPYHNSVNLGELAKRIPKDKFSFYIIDLSNGKYPGFSTKAIGKYLGYSDPGNNLTVFPVNEAGKIKGLLSELGTQKQVKPDTDESNKQEKEINWRKLLAIAIFGIVSIIIMALILADDRKRDRQQKLGKPILFEGAEVSPPASEEKETDTPKRKEPKMVYIKVGDTENRFGVPVKLTIGGGKSDDFRVDGALDHELAIYVAGDRQGFIHKKGVIGKDKGQIYGSRSFSLKNGVSVSVKLESEKKASGRYA